MTTFGKYSISSIPLLLYAVLYYMEIPHASLIVVCVACLLFFINLITSRILLIDWCLLVFFIINALDSFVVIQPFHEIIGYLQVSIGFVLLIPLGLFMHLVRTKRFIGVDVYNTIALRNGSYTLLIGAMVAFLLSFFLRFNILLTTLVPYFFFMLLHLFLVKKLGKIAIIQHWESVDVVKD